MAVVVREVHPSVDSPEVRGNQTAKRSFVIFDNATPSALGTEASVIALFGNGTLPTYGEPHPRLPLIPSGGLGGSGGPASSLPLIAIDYDNLRMDGGGNYVWRVDWNYLRTAGGGSTTTPGTPGYWEYSYRGTQIIDDGYRNKWATGETIPPGFFQLVVPSGGTPPPWSASEPTDILGKPIDGKGNPASLFRKQQVLEITEHIAGQYTAANTFGFVGRRNNATFLGAQAGRLVFTGVSSSARLDTNLFQITFSMVWDEFFHMIQRTTVDSNGDVLTRRLNTTNVNSACVARTVYWDQPFPDTGNFDLISSNWP